jgi:hypothetical protein
MSVCSRRWPPLFDQPPSSRSAACQHCETHPRNRPADPPARLGGRGPASAPKCRCPVHVRSGRPLARAHRDGAAAATDIDDALAGFGLGAADQDVGDGLKQDVLRLLPIGPALAARSIPIRNLIGVSIVGCRGFHAWRLSVGPPSLLRKSGLTAFALLACRAEAP